jgi:hypothetical protein
VEKRQVTPLFHLLQDIQLGTVEDLPSIGRIIHFRDQVLYPQVFQDLALFSIVLFRGAIAMALRRWSMKSSLTPHACNSCHLDIRPNPINIDDRARCPPNSIPEVFGPFHTHLLTISLKAANYFPDGQHRMRGKKEALSRRFALAPNQAYHEMVINEAFGGAS